MFLWVVGVIYDMWYVASGKAMKARRHSPIVEVGSLVFGPGLAQRGEARSATTTRPKTQDPRPGEVPDWLELRLSLAVFTAMQPSFAFEVTAPASGGSP
jgi:hypothetical protein